jgi:3-oxoacyl-[acyl-carrier-protein] synthase II
LARTDRTGLPADKVLVTIGTACSISAVGTTETYAARARGSDTFLLHAAFDAGLVNLSLQPDGSISATWPDGRPATIAQVEQQHGAELRSQLGIRVVDELRVGDDSVVTDIAASLPHDLGRGALRTLAGLTYRDIRDSELRDMHGLFDDDPRLGPSLQSQLFAFAGLGALAALPVPLSELLREPFDFRVAASAAFPGLDGLAQWRSPATSLNSGDGPRDKFAARLASSLASHGPALVSTMLAPSYPIGKSTKNPALLDSLRSGSGYMRVPQSPQLSVGACASALIGFSEFAPQMLFDYPGFRRPQVALWTAADAATQPGWKILEAFGAGAMMTSAKLDEINAGRAPADRRSVAESLAPFDVDANGTVVGDGGSGLLVTTLDFALRNFLDITSIIVGWGHSGEAGGKAHFAGVGFGGENALVHAFEIADHAHGYGVGDFRYLVAHATGTRTNSKTDLTTVASARAIAAERAGATGALPRVAVGTPKALGDGHTMGETGLKAVAQAIRYLLGEAVVGVPTLRTLDPMLAHLTDEFELSPDLVPGDSDGGAICATQGFGGYNGAIALRAANPDSIRRYTADPGVLAAYLERWPTIRRDRERRERQMRIRRASTLELAHMHRWAAPG